MANKDNIPVSVDYTSRDFYSLKQDLISRIQIRLADKGKVWNGTDSSDFGVALVEAFAYVGDVTNYYVDRMANEAYISTATQRQHVLDIAELYGYVPSGYRQAIVLLNFQNTSTTTTYTIPEGTQLTVDVVNPNSQGTIVNQLIFTVLTDVIVASNSTVTGYAVHGEDVSLRTANLATDVNDIDGELLGYSTGLPSQEFVLKDNTVVDGSVNIYVNNGNSYVRWTQVDQITDYGQNDTVYSIRTDANNYVHVMFGDGVSGAIPLANEPIKSVYQSGGGLIGNLEPGYSFHISKVPASSGLTVNNLSSIVITNNSAATGGEEPESTDVIRKNAPRSLKALNRAVTLSDYANLALSVNGVGKAVAYATTPTSITLYVGPQTSDISQDYYPGYSGTFGSLVITNQWNSLKSQVETYLSGKTQIGTTVTILPPSYTPVHVSVEYAKDSKYTHAQIKAALNYAIIYGYGYNFLDFNKTIYPEQIESNLSLITGVTNAKVLELHENGGGGRNTLVAGTGEYYVFSTNDTKIYPIAGLSALVSSNGTVSPTFDPGVFTYNLALSNGTTSITITPTAPNATSTIKVNGVTVASGVASGSISTPVGTTNITVAVTSGDGTAINTYVISAIRTA